MSGKKEKRGINLIGNGKASSSRKRKLYASGGPKAKAKRGRGGKTKTVYGRKVARSTR